ncbi:MAG: PLP-dependent transferase [Bryobacterales bacterium]|nr:PLP-dependent transferase [Bryobacterales bacterium]
MLPSFASSLLRRLGTLSRRELFRRGSFASLGGLLTPAAPSSAAVATGLQLGATPQAVYNSIGVRPLINCRGTLTVIGGSIEIPEVRAVKDLANQMHAPIDEIMHAVGKRLAELTGAEWGMVSSGCAAAMSHATAACVAGGNPDLHVKIPNLAGFSKDEVIIPTTSRNVYDAAIRAIGVKIVEVDSVAALESAIGPKTAMIYIFAGPRAEAGPPSFDDTVRIARQHNVPVFVDAAAEILTIPNIYLTRGATLVGYSGGKYIRGPQSAGLMLGRKDLVQAAWVHSAPHHGYGRSMKVGREEMLGMLMAVESWVKRDHAAEWKHWLARLDHIARAVAAIPGVTTRVHEPTERSNRSPSLSIRWKADALHLTGQQLSTLLDTTEPRIAVGGEGFRRPPAPGAAETGISITAAMMADGDERIVARRLVELLSAKRDPKPVETHAPPAADLSGRWEAEITYAASSSRHLLFFDQKGSVLQGAHQGDFTTRDLVGSMNGAEVRFGSYVGEQHGEALSYRFSGTLAGHGPDASLSGTLDLGEYLTAQWTARRKPYGRA